MDTNSGANTFQTPGAQPSLHDRVRGSRALVPALAVMTLAVAALATALVLTRTHGPADTSSTPVAQAAQLGAGSAYPAPAVPVQPTALVPAASNDAASPVLPAATSQSGAMVMGNGPAPAPGQAAPMAPVVCANCGVVESVVAVKRQAEVKGIGGSQVTTGAVAGGVIGGLLGNQIGHGGGRTAATVLGAAGGAYAGNEIQKNANTYTAYETRVRMNDGSLRTFERRNAMAVGSKVVVEGRNLRLARS